MTQELQLRLFASQHPRKVPSEASADLLPPNIARLLTYLRLKAILGEAVRAGHHSRIQNEEIDAWLGKQLLGKLLHTGQISKI